MNIYKTISGEKEHWFTVQFKIPFNFFIKKLKGNINKFHRLLSNGHASLLGRNNRQFWKCIIGGYYRYYFSIRHIHFVYHLKFREENLSRMSKELQIRISKIFPVKISILPFENMDEVDIMLLSLPKGHTNYKKIKFK